MFLFYFHQKEPGILREMSGYKAGTGNTQDEPQHLYCQKVRKC